MKKKFSINYSNSDKIQQENNLGDSKILKTYKSVFPYALRILFIPNPNVWLLVIRSKAGNTRLFEI